MAGRLDYRRALAWVFFILAGIAALAAVAAHIVIRNGIAEISAAAEQLTPGDRVQALIAYVDCGRCPMPSRNRAVWALGEIGDPRALPVLTKHFHGGRCDHARELCQYELRKALKKID